MKIYINSAKENWVVDRFISEWKKYNPGYAKSKLFNPDIVWLIAPWTWKKVPEKLLIQKNVVCTIHHIDEEKFDKEQKEDFYKRDKFVDHYHVISNKTYNQVSSLTTKPITIIPFWINQNIWFKQKDVHLIKRKYGFSSNDYLIGSFQRDTEGSDLISPKLSKGPDQFFEIVEFHHSNNKNLCVVLTGKRREYLINKLNEKSIKYKYFEMVNFSILNELYNILDLYIVASRYEGGPQSILECAITKTPIISTDVGIASEILDRGSIFDMKNFQNATPNIELAYNNVLQYQIPLGFARFNKLMREINES